MNHKFYHTKKLDRSKRNRSVTHRNQRMGCKHKGRSESPFEQLCTGGHLLFTSDIPPLSWAALNPDRLSICKQGQLETSPGTDGKAAADSPLENVSRVRPDAYTYEDPHFYLPPPFYNSSRPSQTQGQKELVSSLSSEHAASTDTSVTTSVYLSSRRPQTLFW